MRILTNKYLTETYLDATLVVLHEKILYVFNVLEGEGLSLFYLHL